MTNQLDSKMPHFTMAVSRAGEHLGVRPKSLRGRPIMTTNDEFKFQPGDRVVFLNPKPHRGKGGSVLRVSGVNNDRMSDGHLVMVKLPSQKSETMYAVRVDDKKNNICFAAESELVWTSEWDEQSG
jgi:hypothetical protein